MFGCAIEALRVVVDRLQVEVRAVEGDELDWSVVADELVALEREHERVGHLIGCLVSDLEARGAHVRDGARSMATWLTQRTGQRRAIAGSRCALAKKLRSMPATDAAGRILDRAAVSPKNPARRQPLLTVHTNLPSLTGTAGPGEWKAELDMQWRAGLPNPSQRRPARSSGPTNADGSSTAGRRRRGAPAPVLTRS